MKRLWIALLLMACAHVTPEQKIAASSPVFCDAKDCEVKWARATQWLQDNSHWRIRLATESMLATEGPLGTDFTAYEITKMPLEPGVYEIRLRARCVNGGFGLASCRPDITQATAAFKQFVNGAPLVSSTP